MQVNPSGTPERVRHTQLRGQAAVSRQPEEQVALGRFDALKAAMNDLPDARAEQVARAQGLVQQPPYPPAEAIRKIANLLALSIEPKS